MAIDRVEVFVTDLPTRLQRELVSGTWDTGPSNQLLGKPVLVKVYADGVVGYGQIRPLAPSHIVCDTTYSMVGAIREIFAPRLLGRDLFDLELHSRAFDQVLRENPASRAAIDHALHDAMGKALGVPVYKLLGGKAQTRIPLEWSVGMSDDPQKMVAEAQRAVDEFGIPVICSKGGHRLGWRQDVVNFAAMRKALGDKIAIGIDPNTAWTVEETLLALKALRPYNLEYLEQPVARRDLSGLADIRRACDGIPLMADESVFTLSDAFELAQDRKVDVFCIKLYKMGGIRAAKKIAAVAEAANIRLNVGGVCAFSQLESSASAHFYTSIPAALTMGAAEFVFGLGVFGPDPLVAEPGLIIDRGHTVVPDRPGLGVTIDEKALKKLTLSHDVIK